MDDIIQQKIRFSEFTPKQYNDTIPISWETLHCNSNFISPLCCTSMVCTSAFFDLPFYQFWIKRMKMQPAYHRKTWELVYIAQSLWENGLLTRGNKGIVFACGKEPLPELFASFGVRILATDLDPNDGRAECWVKTNQNAEMQIEHRGIASKENFKNLVSYRSVDMTNLPEDLTGYDFCWSTCAFEHLGNLQSGLDFVKNSLRVLKPGGLAVHTTELNLSSNENTLERDHLCAYREKDILQLVSDLVQQGHYVYPLEWNTGSAPMDLFVDYQPYYKKDMHLRLMLDKWACTSFGLIIKKDGYRKNEVNV